jgi:hypothetical protein
MLDGLQVFYATVLRYVKGCSPFRQIDLTVLPFSHLSPTLPPQHPHSNAKLPCRAKSQNCIYDSIPDTWGMQSCSHNGFRCWLVESMVLDEDLNRRREYTGFYIPKGGDILYTVGWGKGRGV